MVDDGWAWKGISFELDFGGVGFVGIGFIVVVRGEGWYVVIEAYVEGLKWRFMLDSLVDCASWAKETGLVKGAYCAK